MNTLFRYFFRGLVIVIPTALTVYVIYKTFTAVDRLIARFIDFQIPGIGFALTMVAIVLIGALASNFIGRRIFRVTEQIFTRAPFVKIVYSSVRDLVEAFVGDKRRFNRPVLVALTPDNSLTAAGFITRDEIPFLHDQGKVAVYFPQSYNFAGNLVFVPKERVTSIDVESAQLMTFIVSGGVSGG